MYTMHILYILYILVYYIYYAYYVYSMYQAWFYLLGTSIIELKRHITLMEITF